MRMPDLKEYDGLPDSTRLYPLDIMEIFNYKRSTSRQLPERIKAGLIPQPSKKGEIGLKGTKSQTKYLWLLGDLRKLRKELIEASNNATTR